MFPSVQASPGDVLYPHVLTLLNFHGPYNPYEPLPTAITYGKLSMTLKTSQMLCQNLRFLELLSAAMSRAAVMQVSWTASNDLVCLFIHSFLSTFERIWHHLLLKW